MEGEDERRQPLEAGLRWSWATLRQIERLHSIEDRLRASALHGPPTSFGYKERLPFWELRTEAHFCIVAARQVVRALKSLDPPDEYAEFPHFSASLRAHVIVLRNCFEHWDERIKTGSKNDTAGSAFRRFGSLGVDEDVDGYRFGAEGTVIAGLSLDELAAAARDVHEALRGLEASDFVWRGWEAVASSCAGSPDSPAHLPLEPLTETPTASDRAQGEPPPGSESRRSQP